MDGWLLGRSASIYTGRRKKSVSSGEYTLPYAPHTLCMGLAIMGFVGKKSSVTANQRRWPRSGRRAK